MDIGYARVSTEDQDLTLQKNAMDKVGVSRIFSEHVSGVKTKRPELMDCLGYLRKGDTLVVWKLDRLGRSLKELIAILDDLKERGVAFKSLTESIDTSTAAGELFFHIFGAFAQFERSLISERTKAGLAAAAALGRRGGAPRKHKPAVIAAALKEKAAKKLNHKEVALKYGIKPPTLHRYRQEYDRKQEAKEAKKLKQELKDIAA
jgi:DNA invertase Pin-like site-specific DNA recombinase